MIKTVTIGNQNIVMNANSMLRMYYRTHFNRRIFTDLMESKKLIPFLEKTKGKTKDELMDVLTDEDLGILEDLSDNCLKMAWTMAYCNNKSILPFNEWLESLGDFRIFDSWLSEVLEMVMSTFC